MPEILVAVSKGRVGPNKCYSGCDQQYDPADGFDVQESMQRRKSTLDEKGSSGEIAGW